MKHAGHPKNEPKTLTERTYSWRKLGRRVSFVAIVLLIALALLPRVASLPKFHRFVTGWIARNVAGDLQLQRLQLRWFQPPVVDGIRFTAPDGRPVLELDHCVFNRSLWSLITDSSTFGELRLQQPTFHLMLDGVNSNLRDAIKPTRLEDMPEKARQFIESIERPLAGKIVVEQGRFVFRSAPNRPSVLLQPFGVVGKVYAPTETAGAALAIQPSQLADRIVLSRELCDDLLKFVAPILSEATWVQGAVSVQIDEGLLLLEQLDQSTMSGRVIIHEISAGPGPIAAEISRWIGAPDVVQLVNESQIEFSLKDGQIRHQGLRFELGRLAIETSGVVQLDESVQLVADIRFPEANDKSTPIGERLAGRVIQVPIAGSLQRPRIDWRQIVEHHPVLDEWILRRLSHPEETPILDTLRDLRERRQEAKQDPASTNDRPVLSRLFPGLMKQLESSQPAAEEPADPVADDSRVPY